MAQSSEKRQHERGGGEIRNGSVDRAPAQVPLPDEQVFRLMIEAVKDYGIFLLDPTGRVASWNEGAERIKGYTAEDIIGKHFSTFYPPEAKARDWPAYELATARKQGHFEDEGWRVRKDGSYFWANVVITALWAADGHLVGFTKVTRDLSERRMNEEALRHSQQQLAQANLELAQKNKDLQDFAHVASHDLKEPLRKIRTFLELLEQEYHEAVGVEGRMYMDRIRASVQRMTRLLHDLLSYSRVVSRVQPFTLVDLNRVAEDAISDLQILIEETQGHVESADLPAIVADPTQMRQLFQNLIANALKFHRPGVHPIVSITALPGRVDADGRKWISIELNDNGIGLEAQYAERIFAPFQRLHARHEYAGTGLGLAICKRIVERHGGTIAVRSTVGTGTTFTISLPVEQRPEPPGSEQCEPLGYQRDRP